MIQAFKICQKPLLQIALLRDPWSYEEYAKGGILQMAWNDYVDYRFFDAKGQPYDLILHRKIFTFNPCLYSVELIKERMPTSLVEASFSQNLFAKFPNHQCAYWGQKNDSPKVIHIGDIKGYDLQY